jgi:sugar lactone lactonase YvrE
VSGTIITHAADLTIDSRDAIGEGPTWDSAARRFLWSDNAAGILHEAMHNPDGRWLQKRQWNLGRSIAAALPRANGGFIIAGGTEIFLMDERGVTEPFARLNVDPTQVRFSNAKCDSRGRLWAGALNIEFGTGRGALYRIDPDGSVTTMLQNLDLSHGLDWSPDESNLYHIDSPTRRVEAFEFDKVRGAIGNPRTVVTVETNDGLPDGMTVDREGCLWVALLGAGKVQRYSSEGIPLACVEISAPAVTNCTFGGTDFGYLFITSAAMRLPDSLLRYGFSSECLERAQRAPGAGGVFVCRPGPTGRQATPFAG